MVSEIIKREYRKAFEQELEWKKTSLHEAGNRSRYGDLIHLALDRILPDCRDDPDFKAEVLKNLGYLYDMTDQQQKAVKCLRSASRIYLARNDRVNLSETLSILGDALRDTSKFKEALRIYNRAIEASGRIKAAREFKANSLWGIGDIYRMTGKYSEALAVLKEAQKINRNINSKEGFADVLWTEGYVHVCLGEYKLAEEKFKKIEHMCDSGEVDESHRPSAVGAYADVMRLTGRVQGSIQHYDEAEDLNQRQEDMFQRCWILAVKALSYLQLRQLRDARRVLIQAESIARNLGDPISLIWALQSKGELEKASGKVQEGKRAYLESQKIANSLGCQLEMAHSHLGLAGLLPHNSHSRRNHLKIALRIYRKISCQWGIARAMERMDDKWNGDNNQLPLNYP